MLDVEKFIKEKGGGPDGLFLYSGVIQLIKSALAQEREEREGIDRPDEIFADYLISRARKELKPDPLSAKLVRLAEKRGMSKEKMRWKWEHIEGSSFAKHCALHVWEGGVPQTANAAADAALKEIE